SLIKVKLDTLSAADALNDDRCADVMILLLDAETPLEKQDHRIADLVVREGRALVIGMNKSDLAEPARITPKKLREQADHWLPQAKGMPIVAVSGLQGQGLDKLLDAVETTFKVWNTRVPTAALNRFLESAIAQNPPPAISGGRIKLRYMTQPKARPPSF